MNNLERNIKNETKNTNNNDYWGFWGTSGFGLLVIILFSALQTLFLFGFIFIEDGNALSKAFVSDSPNALNNLVMQYSFDGDAISIAEIPAALIGIGFIILFIIIRKQLTIRDYLGLHPPKIKPLLAFLGLMVIAMVAMEFASAQLEIDTPEFMTRVYNSTENIPLLWIAVGVAAPFFEEFLFRGFILEGLRRTFMGSIGAILISSLAWALIHMQYGPFEIISIFLIGILLAIAKLKTNSLYVPIAMHMLMNITASVGMALG